MFDSEEENLDYSVAVAAYKKDDRFGWSYRIFPCEVEADAFAKLVAQSYSKMMLENGNISKYRYKEWLRLINDYFKLKSNEIFGEDKDKELADKLKAERKRLKEKYGDKLNAMMKLLTQPY